MVETVGRPTPNITWRKPVAVSDAQALGILHRNGCPVLLLQAEKASGIFEFGKCDLTLKPAAPASCVFSWADGEAQCPTIVAKLSGAARDRFTSHSVFQLDAKKWMEYHSETAAGVV